MRRRSMSPGQEADARRMAAQGLSATAIGRALHVPRTTVVLWASREGLKLADGRASAVYPHAVMAGREDEARQLASEGVHLTEAARRMGIARLTLRAWAGRNAVAFVRGDHLARDRAAQLRQLTAARQEAARLRRPLTPEQKRAYKRIRRSATAAEVPRDDIMRAIGRPDLIAEANP